MTYSTLLKVKDDLERTLLEEDQALQSSFRADQGLQGSSWSMWTLQANLCVHHSHPWIRTEDRETNSSLATPTLVPSLLGQST